MLPDLAGEKDRGIGDNVGDESATLNQSCLPEVIGLAVLVLKAVLG